MNKVRTLTLCLIAAFAFAAVSASTASAAEKLPAWGKCEVETKHEGRYADAGCTQPVKKVYGKYTGGYEWYQLQQTPNERAEYESTNLKYPHGASQPQPVPETTVTFADGEKITCVIPLEEESQIRLNGAHVTTEAPLFEFSQCHDQQGRECYEQGAIRGEDALSTGTPFERGREQEEGTWTGTASFIADKNGPEPVVGIVYRTEHPLEPLMTPIYCETEGTEPLTITVGGHKPKEALTTTVTPVNVMSSSFTAKLGPSIQAKGTKPLQATINLGPWQAVSYETTMLFTKIYIGLENRRAGEVEKTLELKATP